jgi:integrase
VPAATHQALCTLEPLKRGRSAARENPKVGPVPPRLLAAMRPHLSRPVGALVQLLTGAPPGELLGLRPVDVEIDAGTGVWTFRPATHKLAYREHERVVYFGPRAQEILRPFLLDRPTTAYCFRRAASLFSRTRTQPGRWRLPQPYSRQGPPAPRCEGAAQHGRARPIALPRDGDLLLVRCLTN